MAASAAGEEKDPEEQAPWFGQPAQAAALPASWEAGPTHPSLALDGAADDMVGLMGSELVVRVWESSIFDYRVLLEDSHAFFDS